MASSRERKEKKLQQLYERLEELKSAYKRALTAQSWETKDGMNSRSVTNADLASLSREIKRTEDEIESLEEMLEEGMKCFGLRIGGRF